MTLLTKKDSWAPYSNYYASQRYKSLIEHNNDLYLCIETHNSTDYFDEAKFEKIGSGQKINPYYYRWLNIPSTNSDITCNIQESFDDELNVITDLKITVLNGIMNDGKSLNIIFNSIDSSYYSPNNMFL